MLRRSSVRASGQTKSKLPRGQRFLPHFDELEDRSGRGDVPRRAREGPFLRVFEPDFYFDDQLAHLHSAAFASPSGHVDAGMANVTAFAPRR